MMDDSEERKFKGTTKEVLEGLTDNEVRVLRERFGLSIDEGIAVERFGEDFLVALERIREIEARAMRRLKELRGDPPDDVA